MNYEVLFGKKHLDDYNANADNYDTIIIKYNMDDGEDEDEAPFIVEYAGKDKSETKYPRTITGCVAAIAAMMWCLRGVDMIKAFEDISAFTTVYGKEKCEIKDGKGENE